MKKTKNFILLKPLPILVALCSLFTFGDCANAARAVVRGTASAARKPSTPAAAAEPVAATTTTTTSSSADEEPAQAPEKIANKSSQFDDVLSSNKTSSSSSSKSDSEMAERIRKQRAAFAASENSLMALSSLQNSLSTGKNTCDSALRKCMMDTCGADLSKCVLDGDTIFGDKLNRCRRDTNCTAEEFKLFTAEIKADRDLNVQLSSYNSVLKCGEDYNGCIIDQCGPTFSKCLGKAAGDRAVQACASIAQQCKEQDSGLPSRIGTVFSKLRENAEVDIKKDEKRMYELRDLMRTACTKMGAMFDERTFDCLFTINFFAGKEQTIPMSSRKRYAGDTFECNQEWFGIDVTTFKENAYRETRSQKGATSAMLGAGLGTAAGLWSSGAIDRALETQKAKKELDQAKAGEAAASDATKKDETKTDDKTDANKKDKPANDKGNTKKDKKTTNDDPKTNPNIKIAGGKKYDLTKPEDKAAWEKMQADGQAKLDKQNAQKAKEE